MVTARECSRGGGCASGYRRTWAFRVLAAGYEPNFRTISDFRRIHLQAQEGLFQQVLPIALEPGAIQLGRVASDGSRLKANASKHKAMSYQRMKEQEQRLHEEVRRSLRRAEAIGAEEDAEHGRDNPGNELPAELQRRKERLRRIREAKRALEEQARAEAEAEGKSKEEQEAVKPDPKMQYNFSDPVSRILKGPDGFLQGYHAQIAVEPVWQLIVRMGARKRPMTSGNCCRCCARSRNNPARSRK